MEILAAKFWVTKLVLRLLVGNKPTRPWTIQKQGKPGDNKEDFADPPPTAAAAAAAAASSQHHAACIPPSEICCLPRVHLVHPKHSRSPPLPFASTTLPPLQAGWRRPDPWPGIPICRGMDRSKRLQQGRPRAHRWRWHPPQSDTAATARRPPPTPSVTAMAAPIQFPMGTASSVAAC